MSYVFAVENKSNLKKINNHIFYNNINTSIKILISRYRPMLFIMMIDFKQVISVNDVTL